MWRMGAKDPGGLQKERVLGRHVAGLVLVFGAESQELAPVPGDVGGDAPGLLVGVESVFSPVQSYAGVPVAIELLLHKEPRAPGVLGSGARSVGDAVDRFGLDELVEEAARGVGVDEGDVPAEEV